MLGREGRGVDVNRDYICKNLGSQSRNVERIEGVQSLQQAVHRLKVLQPSLAAR